MENLHWIENDDYLNGDDFGAAHRYNNEWYMPKFHTHTHYEFYLFLSGNVQILIEDDAFDARPMDLFIFPPGIMHRAYLVDPHTNYERAYFYATSQALHNFSNDQLPLLPTLEKAVLQKDYCYHIGEKNGNEFLQLIDAYIRDESLKDPYSLEMQCLRMHYLSLEVCRIIHGTLHVLLSLLDNLLYPLLSHQQSQGSLFVAVSHDIQVTSQYHAGLMP